MNKEKIRELAAYLNDAELNRQEIFKITLDYPELTDELAYDIQHEIVNIKEESGDRVIGMKMGLTSEAKMKQMGISEPLYGHILDYMLVDNRGEVSLSELIHPKVEAEIAFIMGKDLQGSNITEDDVLDAIEYVLPAMELVDSRFENFNFTLKDVIADNCSSSRVILGDKYTKPDGLRMELLGTSLSINNEIVDMGTGAAVLGNPLTSVVMLVKLLDKRGLKLKANSLVLTGGITKAFMIKEGDIVSTRIEDLGEVSFKVVK